VAITTQDLDKGVDFTGINPATGGDHNNLVNLAAPHLDTNGDGKGLVIVTHDLALNTPVVPDCGAVAKWKRYIWVRVLFGSTNNYAPLIYGWNDNAVNDATYQKWVQLLVDLTTLNAALASATALAQNAKSTADGALLTANNAAVLANTASNEANNAEIDAQTAITGAATASNNAAAAVSSASAANNTANAALTAAGAKKDVNNALNPGTAGQHIRTRSDALAVEWYDEANLYVKLSYSPAKATAPEISLNGDWALRKVETEDSDVGGLVTLAANIITFAVPGIYRVHIVAPCYGVNIHKAALVDNDTNLVLLMGTNAGGGGVCTNSIICGVITITNVIKNLAIHHYSSDIGKFGSTAGANIDFPKVAGVATKEIYLTAEFKKIN
jgi:hypothetical protein